MRMLFNVAALENLHSGGNAAAAQPMWRAVAILVDEIDAHKQLGQGILAAFAVVLVHYGRNLVHLVNQQRLQLPHDAYPLFNRFSCPSLCGRSHLAASALHVRFPGHHHRAKLLARCRINKWQKFSLAIQRLSLYHVTCYCPHHSRSLKFRHRLTLTNTDFT